MGNTPQAQSTQRFHEALAAIQGMSPSSMSSEDLTSGQAQAQSGALGLQANQGQAVADASATLTNQAGIPGLNNQFGDLSKAFEMYLADTDLAGKYSSGANPNPYANAGLMAAGEGNPYNAPIDQMIGQSEAPAGTFSTPGLTTRAMGAPMDATTNMLDLLQSALSGQTKMVDTKTSEYEKNYKGAMDALASIAGVFGDERKRQSDAEGNNLNLGDILGLGTKDSGFTPTEPKPTILPGQITPANTKRLYSSPDGQWIFDWASNDWVPVVQ